MSNSVIPIDRYDAKESGRAIQEAQNTIMATGAAATIAMIRELLKSLKLPEKSVNVEIAINDSVAYQANAKDSKFLEAKTSNLSEQQLRYLKEVVKLPESKEPAAASIPLDKDVTITVDGKAVFRLKDGIALKNLLAPVSEQVREKPTQSVEILTTEPEIEETPTPEVQETVENVVGQNSQGYMPINVVLNREVESNVPKSSLKDNLKSTLSRFQKVVSDLSRKVSSFLSSARDRFLPGERRAMKRDLENIAVINVASHLLERFGSKTYNGKQVFEGNTFYLERQDNNLTVTAKDGRGTILRLKDGELASSLTAKDVEKFQAVARQLNRDKLRQSQVEMG